MSVRLHRGGWEVRWRDASGRQRARRFTSEDAARAFDGAIAEVSPAARRADTARHARTAGVYSYATASGTRWRFVYRRTDGTQTTKRGFSSEPAARDARRRLIEQVERGEVRHTKETFGSYWERWLARRRPYLEPGTWTGYEIHGRLRLVPAFRDRPLGELSVDDIRGLVAGLAEGGRLTVFASAHIEREYLRLNEIPRYLDSCSDVYRPLAELLIGSGLRISEALALRASDLELEDTGGAIIVYRSRKKDGTGSTKSDRFRSVRSGPVSARCFATSWPAEPRWPLVTSPMRFSS